MLFYFFTAADVRVKILINKGRSFYEKGIWCTLENLKVSFNDQKFNFAKNEKADLTEDQIKFIESEFVAWESRIELIEKVEASIIPSLKNLGVNSITQAQKIDFTRASPNLKKDNFNKGWTKLSLLPPNTIQIKTQSFEADSETKCNSPFLT